MNHESLISLLKETGTLRDGHFVLTSGRHSNQFLLFSQLTQHPEALEQVCAAMAAPYLDAGIETVIGPAMGGVVLAYEVARQIARGGKSRPRAIYTEKAEAGMALKRGWSLRQGERVLVVEDAVTTGGSVDKCLDAIRPMQPEIVAVSIIADRSGGTVDFRVPMHAVTTLQIESWLPGDCPLCKQGVPVVKPKS